MRRRFGHRRRRHYEHTSEGGLELSALGDLRITGLLGEGVSCRVHAAEWKGRQVALKLYKAAAVERHHRLVGADPAVFEYERNRAFYDAPELACYVAEPLAYLADGTVSAMVQEKLEGKLYYHHHVACGGRTDGELFEHVRRIVDLAHAADLYDIDLHARNLIVVEQEGAGAVPKLFDFNFIPFYLHAPNPLVWLLLKAGIVDHHWRDRRKLRSFHDFRRIERNLRGVQEPARAAARS